jgi:hypothetical protein
MGQVHRIRLCMGCGESLQGRFIQHPDPVLEDGSGQGAGKDRQRDIAKQRTASRQRSGHKE